MSVGRSTSAPWLTVIMPTHRGEQWIDASLRSLAAEAAEGVEVLVLDSSPTPATLDIARGYSDRLHLRAVERRDLLMWHAKTNFGVQIADSNHICWLHQDDLWLPGRAAAVRAWIESAPNASLHLAPSAIIDRSGRLLGVWRCPLPTNGELPSVLVTERLLVQNFVAAPSPVFRKDAWLACGGLDEKLWYTADWDMWLKLAASGPVYYHDGVTTGFRIHGGSLTVAGSRDVADFAQQMQIVLDRHLSRFCDRSMSVERVGLASIAVNTALAAASAGDLRGLLPAVFKVLQLGPAGIRRYIRDSRIVDRMAPRMRAKLGGAF
jgi:glycosyltransferase involved in cell wall biosynthesis